MREIKFEFVYKRKSDGYINKLLFNMTNNHEHFGKAYLRDDLLAEYDLIAKRQYTGLKDKNGVEIYHGDILYDSFSGSRKWIVGISMPIEIYFILTNDKVYTETLSFFSKEHIKGFEVIGNIYENEELLSQ